MITTDLTKLTMQDIGKVQKWYYPRDINAMSDSDGNPLTVLEAVITYNAGCDWDCYNTFAKNLYHDTYATEGVG